MSVNDCIQFLRSSFKVTKSVFDKEYLYSIRHNYGLEGKRANYPCYACSKIIDKSSDASTFGCPFVSNMEYVKKYMADRNVEIGDIEELARKGHHQKACTTLLEGILGHGPDNNVSTPIYFFKTLKLKRVEDTNDKS
jgi:DNA primase large subunit